MTGARFGAWLTALVLAVAGCVPTYDVPAPPPTASGPRDLLPPRQAAANFIAAVDRVQPVAEAMCRATTRGVPCTFRIVIDDRPDQAPNAFQTLDGSGRPVLGFTPSLIALARSADEIAFVIGHEAAHHILGHLPQQTESAMAGALMAGVLASIGGADEAAILQAQDTGALLATRRYSKTFELEADYLGAQIVARAGFDALRGAQFFSRLPDPGDRFLGTHPPNADRMLVVRRAVADLR